MSTEVKAISVWAVLIITPLCFQWWITALVVASAAIVHFTLWAMAEEKSECAYPHFHHRDIPAMVFTPFIALLVFWTGAALNVIPVNWRQISYSFHIGLDLSAHNDQA
jgi:hypothetical protein